MDNSYESRKCHFQETLERGVKLNIQHPMIWRIRDRSSIVCNNMPTSRLQNRILKDLKLQLGKLWKQNNTTST
ncbi:hypothetical protein T07_13628 [Trichinella nelsoni]|uniref:Uncharacterized protein n=1 Tax=Trichinella nelsoni TaxID=6336 RepID=A0A0V0S8H7_9BILA|nr:hypothetical protein T07_13628 [Trichinella nelsoni]